MDTHRLMSEKARPQRMDSRTVAPPWLVHPGVAHQTIAPRNFLLQMAPALQWLPLPGVVVSLEVVVARGVEVPREVVEAPQEVVEVPREVVGAPQEAVVLQEGVVLQEVAPVAPEVVVAQEAAHQQNAVAVVVEIKRISRMLKNGSFYHSIATDIKFLATAMERS